MKPLSKGKHEWHSQLKQSNLEDVVAKKQVFVHSLIQIWSNLDKMTMPNVADVSHSLRGHSQQRNACLKLTIETLARDVTYAQR